VLDQQEERLIEGVKRGAIPLTTTLEIARAKDDDEGLSEVLQETYENSQLNRGQIIEIKRLVEKRQADGEHRVMVLIEILSKPVLVRVAPSGLRKTS
jgi:ParB family transcriptional regulator, chromosome partitioning protein